MSTVVERLSTALADRYRIERELGQGGMATVYLAEDVRHKRKVALKVLKPELAAVLGAERFVQEITTTAALQHPHILPLFDSGTADGFLYYVMPFIDGETLRAKLDRETQLGVDEAVRITSDVASALHYAHMRGVIHRDIKPENILLHEGRPMVADFGIALAVSAAAGGRMTETGLSLGTPHYMSPEQATAEKEINARSDVYSLASVLYEMLSGNPPHTGASAQQIIMKIVTQDAAPVTELRKSVPPHVAGAVAKALQKLPADRFESARAFAEALQNPAFAYGAALQQARGARVLAASRRMSVLHAALTVGLAMLLVWALLGRRSADRESHAPWIVDLGIPDSAAFGNGMSLTRDGSLLVFGSLSGGGRLWMRGAGMVSPTQFPGGSSACCPAISPDGKSLAFVRGSELYQVPVSGGTATLLGRGFRSGDDIAWTGDGYVVGPVTGGLRRVPVRGGELEFLTTVDSAAGEWEHWSPRALPGGRGVLFTIVPWDASDSVGPRIGVVGPEGGKHTVLMPGRVAGYAEPGYLLVTRADGSLTATPFDVDSRRLTGAPTTLMTGLGATSTWSWLGYFTVADNGKLIYVGGGDYRADLAWLTRSGSISEVDSSGSGRWNGDIRVAPDGRTMAVESVVSDNMGVDLIDRVTRAGSRLQISPGRIYQASFTADGRSLVFRATAPGVSGIYRAELRRPAERTSLLAGEGTMFPSLSPDERTLYYVRRGVRGAEYVAKSLAAPDSAARVLFTSLITTSAPALSPDGRWVACVVTLEGAATLQVRSTDPGRTDVWQVASGRRIDEGSAIRWSKDGRELFFIASDSLVATRVSGSEVLAVGRVESLFGGLQLYDRLFDVGPDGRFLFKRFRLGSSGFRLVMVENWRALMAP